MGHAEIDLDIVRSERRTLDQLGPRIVRVAGGIGLVALVASVILAITAGDGGRHFFFAYLVAFTYFLSLALGGLFFVGVIHLTRAGWAGTVRRLGELIAATLPALVVLSIPVFIGLGELYVWTDPAVVEGNSVLEHKQSYLDVGPFVVRLLVYFVVWAVIARAFLARSVKQDETAEPVHTTRMERLAAPSMILFALTITFASIDLIMTLEPMWYSTIFGTYYFSGAAVGFFALIILVAMWLQQRGLLAKSIRTEHYHDLGKLLFAFIVFWAYIAFSQYMLIWYASIPEEVSWLSARLSGGWAWVAGVLLFGHFLVPFLALMSRHPKRRKSMLAAGCVWMLLMHWVDLYWLIMPAISREGSTDIPFNVLDITCFAAVGGLFIAALALVARNRSLIAVNDPRLVEAMAYENM